jgi:MFS superfamily sulfate permease-like transporter
MHQGPRTKYDRELAAQGIGNVICGMLGALPMTGVIVRSAANIDAGARSRASTILHGFWLLVFVSVFPFILRWIPTASLAAILVYTGIKLINFKAIKMLWQAGKSEVLIYSITVATIVIEDLLTGVLVGIGLCILKLAYTFSHLSIRLESQPDLNRSVLYLEGTATFIRLPKLAAALEDVPPNTELHVHFEQLNYIDHACLDLLLNWEKQHESTGGSLVIDWESLTARFRQANRTNGSPHLHQAPGNGDRHAADEQPAQSSLHH